MATVGAVAQQTEASNQRIMVAVRRLAVQFHIARQLDALETLRPSQRHPALTQAKQRELLAELLETIADTMEREQDATQRLLTTPPPSRLAIAPAPKLAALPTLGALGIASPPAPPAPPKVTLGSPKAKRRPTGSAVAGKKPTGTKATPATRKRTAKGKAPS